MPPATIFGEKQHKVFQRRHVRAIDDGPSLPRRHHELRVLEDAEMRRHGILGSAQQFGDVACGQPDRFILHEEAKRIQSARLGESR
ncbi:MAG: hypothetical protein RLZ59_1085 [Pseudomonadota bacterium]